MGDGLFVHGGVTSALEARLALAGLLALQGPTALDVRTGVLAGPGSTALVTGTSATAPMQVAVGVHDGVLSRGTANGPYLMPTEAQQLVNIGAAPGSGTRIDVVYERQKDATAGVPTPDAATAPEYGVVVGTAGAGKPSLAGVVGAEELATVAVSAGATATNGAGVTITNTARQTTTRGGVILLRTAAELAGLTAYPTAQALELDTGRRRWHDGTRWRYEGDRVTVTSTAQRDALTTYTGLRAYDSSIGTTWIHNGSFWDVLSGKLPMCRVYRAVGTAFGSSSFLNIPYGTLDAGWSNNPNSDWFLPKLTSPERRVQVLRSGLYIVHAECVTTSVTQDNYLRVGLMTAGNVMGTTFGTTGPQGAALQVTSPPVRLAAGDHVGAALSTSGSDIAESTTGYRNGLTITRLSS